VLVALTTLLLAQLIGEAITRSLGLTVPGPVIGMILLAIGIALSRNLRRVVEPTAIELLRNLSLLFVPAGVGIVQYWDTLRTEGVAIGVALLVSAAATLSVTALTFRFVSRRLGLDQEEQ
jgi:holin-like protein